MGDGDSASRGRASVTNRSYLAPPGAVPEGQAAITMIGHAGVLVRVDGFTLLTDPQFSTHAGPGGRIGTPRVRPPGIEPRDLPAVNAVFISHNHYDHLDIASLRWLTAQRAPAFVTLPRAQGAARAQGHRAGDRAGLVGVDRRDRRDDHGDAGACTGRTGRCSIGARRSGAAAC